MIVDPKTAAFPFPTLAIDKAALRAFLRAEMDAHVAYGLGSKAQSLSDAPGIDRALDCSGFVRYALYKASGGKVVFPDGSVTQHETCERVGFKPSTPEDARGRDGILRIAFLDPADTAERIGHVMLVLDGVTLESHGHHGPDSRVWGSEGFMSLCKVFVLTKPGA